MNIHLLNTLVRRNIVALGTEIEVTYLAPGLDGYCRNLKQDIFSITEFKIENESITQIKCTRITDGAKLITTSENIIKIDGMLPKELAAAFDIKEDGSKKIVKLDEFGNPVKRGRKPKYLTGTKNYDRNNRSNALTDNEAKKSSEGKRRGNTKIEETTPRRKLSSRAISKHQRNVEVSAS
ncbi:MAG: hypothetical protein HC836_48610 [Richelia sp. RM2_1_2]|nr:hypothetical protein [Richelia sp. RM2_1_2]